jgi:hypothetical protein
MWKDSKKLDQKISNFFFSLVMGSSPQIIRNGSPYEKDDAQQQKIMEGLLLFITKIYMPIFIVESQWLRCLIMHQNP